MHVLLCDDEPSIRLLFRTAFERFGADVDEAGDGAACLQRAAAGRPDVVVLDLMMPTLDGLSTLPQLRQLLPGAALFLVSAHAQQDLFEEALVEGADACFDKLAFLDRIPELVGRLGVSA